MVQAMETHRYWMERCLTLAARGQGHVSPNPMVGAVIVYDGRVLAEGYHARYGEDHAEVQALNRVPDPGLLRYCTMYINLEPCTHHGKTPPCADRLMEAGVCEVVIGSLDPNPQVAGAGAEKLREAGVKVITGVAEEQAHFLNRRFRAQHTQHMPYVILKWAQSADGFLADENGHSGWLSNVYARTLVHQWRAQEDAIMVGARTALQDNPQLTSRQWQGNDPLRIVLDPDLKVSGSAHLLDQSVPTWVLNQHQSQQDGWVSYKQVEADEQALLSYLLSELIRTRHQSVIVEGGGMLLDTFVRYGLWHEARIFTGTRHIGAGVEAPALRGRRTYQDFIGNDLLQYWINT
jgi:diaminohydroxyphosphoribosylaminopyrimidine deaminase/5-amino-6-(5-phosphoribosylamino)uracil reductase